MSEFAYLGKILSLAVDSGRRDCFEILIAIPAKTLAASSDNPSVFTLVVGGIVIAGLLIFLIIHKRMQNKKVSSDSDKSQFDEPKVRKKTENWLGNTKNDGDQKFSLFGKKKSAEQTDTDQSFVQPSDGYYVPPEGRRVVDGNTGFQGMDINTPTVDLSTYMRENQAQKVSQQPKEVNNFVIGVNGSMYGTSYWINENGVTFGRDPSCNYAFPGSDKSISRFHCIVYAAEGMICIMDNASTNGTFRADGHKLQANVPEALEVGDRFYLGTPDNMFEIRNRL